MTIEEKIFAALTADSPTALRVYVDEMPQTPGVVFPLLVFSVITGSDDMHLQGDAGTRDRVVQIDAYAKTRLSADTLAKEAKRLMLASQDFTVNSIDLAPAPRFEPGRDLYRKTFDFGIRYEETSD